MKERMRSLHENRIFALIVWLIAIFAAIVLMQNTSSLVQQKGQPQLANDSQPVIAQGLQRNWGRDVGNTYTVTAVFNKDKGTIGSTEQANIDNTISKLSSHQKFYGIKAIQTLETNPTAKSQYLSADNSTEIVQLAIDRNQGEIRVIANQLQGQLKTTGLNTYVTSPEIVNDVANQKVSDTTTVATVILFILALIIMGILFKSLVAPIITTLALLMAYAVSLSIVNNLAVHLNFAYSEYTPLMVLLTTLLLGLMGHFVLLRQFRQQLEDGKAADAATKDSIRYVRYFLLVVGITLVLIFAGFALFNFSTLRAVANLVVPTIVTILATLTVSPIFMNLLGDRFFWPAVASDPTQHGFWNRLTRFGLWQPAVAIIAVLYFVGPFAYTYRDNLNFNASNTLASSQQSLTGMHVLNAHFSQGKATPITVYVKADDRLDNEKALLQLDNLTTKLQSMPGVSSVTSLTQPNGQPISEYYVNSQLNDFNMALKGATDQLDDLADSLKHDQSNLDKVKLDSDADKIDALATRSSKLVSDTTTVHSQVDEIAGRANVGQRSSASRLVRRYQRLLRLINTQLQTVSSNMRSLSSELSTNQSDASSVSSNVSSYATQVKDVQKDLKKTTKSLQGLVKSYNDIYSYLSALQASDAAKIYYLTPEQLTSSQFQQSLIANTSENYKTTTLQVTLKNSATAKNMDSTVKHLQDEVNTQLQGTSLKNAQVAFAGQPVVQSTVQNSVMSYFGWIVALIIGVFFVMLAIVGRSVLQPIYWLFTYGLATLAATQLAQLTVSFLTGNPSFNWQVPLITLVPVLVLGISQLMQVAINYRYNDLPFIDWLLPSLTEMGQTLRHRLFGVLAISLGLLFTGYAPIVTAGWIMIYTVLIFNVILPILIAAFGKLTVTLPLSKPKYKHHV